eukprot:9247-Heterococcus_DN1.PRE.3
MQEQVQRVPIALRHPGSVYAQQLFYQLLQLVCVKGGHAQALQRCVEARKVQVWAEQAQAAVLCSVGLHAFKGLYGVVQH